MNNLSLQRCVHCNIEFYIYSEYQYMDYIQDSKSASLEKVISLRKASEYDGKYLCIDCWFDLLSNENSSFPYDMPYFNMINRFPDIDKKEIDKKFIALVL